MKLYYVAFFTGVARAYSGAGDLAVRSSLLQQVTDRTKPLPACGLLNEQSLDCIIQISVRRAPAICTTNPQATECVLNYFPAFCGDILQARAQANDPVPADRQSVAIEICTRSVSLGPCVANPHGAACKSGLFAGIKYQVPTDGGPGSRGTSKRDDAEERRRQETIALMRAMLPEEKAKQQPIMEMMLGAAKWVFNEASSMVKFFFGAVQKHNAAWCIGIAKSLKIEQVDKACRAIWNYAHDDIPAYQAAYTSDLQRQGALCALVISSLLVLEDVIAAGRYIGPQAWEQLRALFKAPVVFEMRVGKDIVKGFEVFAESDVKGSVKVTMRKAGPKGEVAPFASEEEAQNAMDEATRNAFDDCFETVKVGRKRSLPVHKRIISPPCEGVDLAACLRRMQGLDIACPPVTTGDTIPSRFELPDLEVGESSSSGKGKAIDSGPKGPPQPAGTPYYTPYRDAGPTRTIGTPQWENPNPKAAKLPLPPGHEVLDDLHLADGQLPLKPGEPPLARQMHDVLVKVVESAGKKNALPTYGRNIDNWVEKVRDARKFTTNDQKADFIYEFAREADIDSNEIVHLRHWHKGGPFDTYELGAAMKKLPVYKGLCIRPTKMTQATMDMLLKRKAGVGGIPGIYDVNDLVVSSRAAVTEADKARFSVMSTSPGLDARVFRDATEQGYEHFFVIRSKLGRYPTPVTLGADEVAFVNQAQGHFKLEGWAGGFKDRPEIFYFDNIE